MKEPKRPSSDDPGSPGQLHVASDKVPGEGPILVNDEAIIRLVIKEDPQKGFGMIFTQYYRPLCNHAARFVYSREIAEDLVSEIFLEFWRKRLFETVRSTFRAYLYSAVRNRAFNFLKQEFSEPLPAAEGMAEPGGWIETEDPQRILLLNELFGKIERTISSFSPQCQKVFLLSRFEGKKNREIAGELHIRIKTVEAHMMKALALLKKALADYLK